MTFAEEMKIFKTSPRENFEFIIKRFEEFIKSQCDQNCAKFTKKKRYLFFDKKALHNESLQKIFKALKNFEVPGAMETEEQERVCAGLIKKVIENHARTMSIFERVPRREPSHEILSIDSYLEDSKIEIESIKSASGLRFNELCACVRERINCEFGKKVFDLKCKGLSIKRIASKLETNPSNVSLAIATSIKKAFNGEGISLNLSNKFHQREREIHHSFEQDRQEDTNYQEAR